MRAPRAPGRAAARATTRSPRPRPARLAQLADVPLLLHPRAANPGHYDAVLALCRSAGVEPRVLERSAELDLAQTPVVDGRAVAVVGESSRTVIPAALTWVALSPPRALDVALVARAGDRAPAVDRLLDRGARGRRSPGLARRPCRAALSTCSRRSFRSRRRGPSLGGMPTTTSIDNKQVIDRYVAALAAGDADAVRDFFAPDATWWLGGDLPDLGHLERPRHDHGRLLRDRDGLLRAGLGRPSR